MRTTVSLPDAVFADAERLAKRLKISRSQLYGRALSDYVSWHAPDAVTEALDRIYAEPEAGVGDGLVSAASRRVLGRTEW
jgi:predicted transcriptional regulator